MSEERERERKQGDAKQRGTRVRCLSCLDLMLLGLLTSAPVSLHANRQQQRRTSLPPYNYSLHLFLQTRRRLPKAESLAPTASSPSSSSQPPSLYCLQLLPLPMCQADPGSESLAKDQNWSPARDSTPALLLLNACIDPHDGCIARDADLRSHVAVDFTFSAARLLLACLTQAASASVSDNCIT